MGGFGVVRVIMMLRRMMLFCVTIPVRLSMLFVALAFRRVMGVVVI